MLRFGTGQNVRDEDGASCEGRVIETGARAVTARVEEILGFQADQFRQVVLLPQGQFRQALTANSAERAGDHGDTFRN